MKNQPKHFHAIGNIIYSLSAILICLTLGHGIYFLVGGIPASLYGMILMTLFLSQRIIKEERLTATIQWIITNMGICFVPAAVGILEYLTLIKQHGLSITLLVVITTLLLLAVVGYFYQSRVADSN